MNEEQRFAFDTWGFLTVEDAITASPPWPQLAPVLLIGNLIPGGLRRARGEGRRSTLGKPQEADLIERLDRLEAALELRGAA